MILAKFPRKVCSEFLELGRISLRWLWQDSAQPTQVALGLVDKVDDGLVVLFFDVTRIEVGRYDIVDVLNRLLE